MMTEWHFEEKIYRRWVVLMIGTWEELIEKLMTLDYAYVDDMTKAAGMNIRLTYDNSNCSYTIIWMPKFSASVLVHELVHLSMATFDRASVPIEFGNEEAFAFYMEYWLSEMRKVRARYPRGRTAVQAKRGA